MAIKVFIIDNSVMVRTLFSQVINEHNEMNVVGVAGDPIMAERKMANLDIDVIILDIEMPKMNGLDYLKQIMSSRPIPIIMCSNLVEDKNSAQAQRALSLGAVGLIGKNNSKIREFIVNSSNLLIQNIKQASVSKIKRDSSLSQSSCPISPVKRTLYKNKFTDGTIIAIGSSTGGVQIIEQILKDLPAQTPPILIVQHMPAAFVSSMAARINSICKIEVKEAVDGEIVQSNTAYISPGNIHMYIKKVDSVFRILLSDGIKISHHKPSVDVLFNSFAKEVPGYNIKAFILTGMGFDGAAGINAIKKSGGKTYAQDELSCTVYGMPKEAIKLGAIDRSLTPSEIPTYIINR